MPDVLKLIFGVLASLFKSRAKLEAKILVLRQQINVIRRRSPKRPHLNSTDRFLFVWLYRWFPCVLGAVAIVMCQSLISSIRWGCLDHMIAFGEAHLRRIVGSMYAAYYNEARTHQSLNKDATFHRVIERIGAITSQSVLGGLHHNYCRI